MNNQLTLGVVGHVDHGKTALVRAMTGIETDRLREEQERGLSIVLGFSYLETTQGLIDLIDVPGHEDFIRAMISGATGIDGIVLIVAADEGIMPQTREHFDIAQVLEIERGIGAFHADAKFFGGRRSNDHHGQDSRYEGQRHQTFFYHFHINLL